MQKRVITLADQIVASKATIQKIQADLDAAQEVLHREQLLLDSVSPVRNAPRQAQCNDLHSEPVLLMQSWLPDVHVCLGSLHWDVRHLAMLVLSGIDVIRNLSLLGLQDSTDTV